MPAIGTEIARHARYALRTRWLIALGTMLLTLDGGVIGLNLLMWFGYFPTSFTLSMESDGQLPEKYEAVKLLAAAGILGVLAVRARHLSYAATAVILTYLAADNMMELHEAAGAGLLADPVLGEALVMTLLGGAAAAVVLLGLFGSTGRERRMAVFFAVAGAAFGGFAVGVDLLHALAPHGLPTLRMILTAIEEGGEMVTISAFLIGTLVIATAPADPVSPSRTDR